MSSSLRAAGLAFMPVLLVAIFGCASNPTVSPSPSAEPSAGGTLRVVMAEDPLWGEEGRPVEPSTELDPHLEWPPNELMRCCLARNLVSTNGRGADDGGSHLLPDIASDLPEVSTDGLTWTFKLRRGIRYAPPLDDMEVTAADFIRSAHRLMSPNLEAAWVPLFDDVVGATAYRNGEATSISGFESPDPHTLVIRLERPVGDLAARLATSAMIPIPANPRDPSRPWGVADGHDSGYGPFLVSSGPYMFDGADSVDLTVPANQRESPVGFSPYRRFSLVRNPSWDVSTDALRPALPDRIEVSFAPTLESAVALIRAGDADLLIEGPYGYESRPLVTDAAGNGPGDPRLYVNEVGGLLSLTMVTAQAPFDDVHVRRAVQYAIDKASVIEALGGPLHFRTAHHAVPDSMLDNLLVGYQPYMTQGGSGDVEAAMAEMAQSRYDANADGVCDAAECLAVEMRVIDGPEWLAVAELVGEALARLGIETEVNTALFEALLDPSLHAAMFVPLGWGRDYFSASNFLVGQYYSPVAMTGDIPNATLVGASREQLDEWGWEGVEVPNVDGRMEACLPLTGVVQFECWAALDQYLTENVAPAVPIGVGVAPVLASARVSNYEWDELSSSPAYDQISIAP